MRKVAGIEFEKETINIYLWADGDGYEANCIDFETENELVEYLKGFGSIERACTYDPDHSGESILKELKYNGPIGVIEDGPGLYIK